MLFRRIIVPGLDWIRAHQTFSRTCLVQSLGQLVLSRNGSRYSLSICRTRVHPWSSRRRRFLHWEPIIFSAWESIGFFCEDTGLSQSGQHISTPTYSQQASHFLVTPMLLAGFRITGPPQSLEPPQTSISITWLTWRRKSRIQVLTLATRKFLSEAPSP